MDAVREGVTRTSTVRSRRPDGEDVSSPMPQPPTDTPAAAESPTDTWPWQCLRCGATIFHDGDHCPDCARSRSLARVADGGRPERGFRAWIRAQSYPSFVATVTAVAGIELGLTALGLRLLLGAGILPAMVGG